MGKRTTANRMVRYGPPRRSKHHLYMEIIPILPDFTLIVKNIEKIREFMDRTQFQEKQLKRQKENSKPKVQEIKEKKRITRRNGKSLIEVREKSPLKPTQPPKQPQHTNRQIKKRGPRRKKAIIENEPQNQIGSPPQIPEIVQKNSPQTKRPKPSPCLQLQKKPRSKMRDQQSFTFFNSIESYFL